MKATLTFDLDDPDDAQRHKQALAGTSLIYFLSERLEDWRMAAKHRDDEKARWARDNVYTHLADYDLNLDDLVGP